MAVLRAVVRQGRLTVHGKRTVAQVMYSKGKAFLGAGVLLKREGGHDLVVLYLLCQGIELVLKGVLLLANYDGYKPKLRGLGHHLDRLADAAVAEFGLNPLPAPFTQELQTLSSLYSQHFLRYGTPYDFLRGPDPVPSQRVWRKTVATLRLIERSIRSA